jgi:hypothetical protein
MPDQIITETTSETLDSSAKPAIAQSDKALRIQSSLTSYWQEADNARKGGLNPRDGKWEQNLDLYWNRVDFSQKADWQAKETMPEVPGYVDRFAAALKEALVATPQGFYTVSDPADKENDLAGAVKRIMDLWLDTVGTNPQGSPLPFASVFEEQMKMGALMAVNTITTWKDNRVAVESLDPRKTWLDATGRNLYRVRRTEIDRHQLGDLLNARDSKQKLIYDPAGIAGLVQGMNTNLQQEKEQLTGSGQNISSARQPITLDEYIATVLDDDGSVLADRSLMVMANGNYLIRGPEKNPFWHGKDWMLYAPLITAPLSVYGRSYMEDFGSVATTFTTLTNMILDAVHMTAMNAYAMVPGMLLNPSQAMEGMSPNKLFLLEDGYDPKQFAAKLDMGQLPADSYKVWQAIKSELTEAAKMNEIGLGQFAPNSRTSATEINETQQSSSALVRSVAQQVESRWLDQQLDLIWKTGLQHVSLTDKQVAAAAGEDMWAALYSRRRELITRPNTFRARGLSSMIQNAKMLKSLLSILSVIAQSEPLLNQFLQEVDLKKLVDKLFMLGGVDMSSLKLSERDRMIQNVTAPLGQMQEQAQGKPGAQPAGANEVRSLVNTMGVQR